MLGELRDVAASIALDRQLGLLRERHMLLVQKRHVVPADYWVSGQREITEFLRERFYREEIRVALLGEPADARTDEQAFQQREQKLVEYAILMTHRRLVEIPSVGDPAWAER